jgi:hypothetical protein
LGALQALHPALATVLAEAGTKGTQSKGGVTALLPLPQTPAQSETLVPAAAATTSITGESVFAVVDWLSAQLLKTSLAEDRAQEQGQGQGQGQEPFSLAEYLPRGMLSTRYLLEASYQYAGSSSSASSSSSTSVAAGAGTNSSSGRGVVSPAVVVLGKIAPEGDNVADGMQLAGATLAALGLFSVHSAGISSANTNTNTGSSDSVTAPAPVALTLMYPMSWQFKFGGGMGEMTRSMLF